MRQSCTTTANAKVAAKPSEILIVEDDPMLAAILQGRLKKLGYTVPTIAFSGEEALVKAGENHPALVLMDIVLEGQMDGIEAAHCIREQFDIPVVYLTSHTDEETLARARITEPFGYIVKPFEEGELRAAIEISLHRHQGEQKLRRMERWLATTFQSIGDGVIATDLHGKITMLNPVAERITGWNQKEALSRSFTEVFHAVNEKTRRPIENPVEKSIREGVVINLESGTVIIRKDGCDVPIDDSAAPIRDEHDKITGVVVVFRDSTERKRQENEIQRLNDQLEERIKQRTTQLEATTHELEAFTYSVSHDLRAPIRAIEGFSRALVEDHEKVLDDEGKNFLKLVCQNAQRMDKMVSDFLRLSQIGHNPLQMQKTDMTALVKETVLDLKNHFNGKTSSIEIGTVPSVECDPALIRQVWENLLANALKYSRNNSNPRIEVSGTIVGNEVIFCVKDNGVGFEMRHADKLFNVFQRLHTAQEFEGNGIGLVIIKRIVLRHKGRVWAEGKKGEGASFFFSLPVELK